MVSSGREFVSERGEYRAYSDLETERLEIVCAVGCGVEVYVARSGRTR